MKDITVLIPTYKRMTSLVALLTSLCSQTYQNFDIVISDQNDKDELWEHDSIQTLIRILREHGQQVIIKKHLPRLGLAEQRQFLLDQVRTSYCLFLDDDLILEPYVIGKTREIIKEQRCGFVGRAVIGLSYQHDVRPQEQSIELWNGPVTPELIRPNSRKWKRAVLHNAANMYHVAERLGATPDKQLIYKVAWVSACVLYDTQKLRNAGGFMFWKKLPKHHVGEDVLAQLRVMQHYGGCAVLPSGVYHQELPTTVPNRDVNAPEFIQIQV